MKPTNKFNTEADSSSAAPSERSINTIEFQRMVGDLMGCRWKVLPTNVAKLIDYIDQHIARLAAPSPTRESLSSPKTWQQRIAEDKTFNGVMSKEHMFDYVVSEVIDLRRMIQAALAALATPRQTEDGSELSAAIMALPYEPVTGYVDAYIVGHREGNRRGIASAAELASTFAPKEMSGANEMTDADRDALCQVANMARLRGMAPLENRLRGILRYISTFTPKEPAAQGGVPEGFDEDDLANACIECEVPDSTYESLCVALQRHRAMRDALSISAAPPGNAGAAGDQAIKPTAEDQAHTDEDWFFHPNDD